MFTNYSKQDGWSSRQVRPGDMFRASFANLYQDGNHKQQAFMVVAILPPAGVRWPMGCFWRAVIRRLSDGQERIIGLAHIAGDCHYKRHSRPVLSAMTVAEIYQD